MVESEEQKKYKQDQIYKWGKIVFITVFAGSLVGLLIWIMWRNKKSETPQ